MVPVVSTVTCTINGRSTPASASASLLPRMAALVWSRSWLVSTSSASAPPAIRPAAFVRKPSRTVAYGMWPRVGSLVPGPIEPSTQRVRPSS